MSTEASAPEQTVSGVGVQAKISHLKEGAIGTDAITERASIARNLSREYQEHYGKLDSEVSRRIIQMAANQQKWQAILSPDKLAEMKGTSAFLERFNQQIDASLKANPQLPRENTPSLLSGFDTTSDKELAQVLLEINPSGWKHELFYPNQYGPDVIRPEGWQKLYTLVDRINKSQDNSMDFLKVAILEYRQRQQEQNSVE